MDGWMCNILGHVSVDMSSLDNMSKNENMLQKFREILVRNFQSSTVAKQPPTRPAQDNFGYMYRRIQLSACYLPPEHDDSQEERTQQYTRGPTKIIHA